MKHLIALASIAFVLASPCLAQEHPGGSAAQMACVTCHVSENPTEEDAALKSCARPNTGALAGHESSESPDVFILDKLCDIYVTVVFPHKLHASMTEMGIGCEQCHHNNPPGPILGCNACHEIKPEQAKLRQPALKGAYHRQCLGCHREWDHETNCSVCHAKRGPGMPAALPTDTTDIMGILHPNVEAPETKVYKVEDMPDTPYVSFHHREHVDLFGLKCTACHQLENCSNCHNSEQKALPREREDPHEDCSRCHTEQVDSDCTFCHAETERKGFDHELRTGFVLSAYHQEVTCAQCHPEKGTFTDLPRDCNACHDTDWQPSKPIDHSVTGVTLDDMHAELGCADCHNKGIGSPAVCDACHDEKPDVTKWKP